MRRKNSDCSGHTSVFQPAVIVTVAEDDRLLAISRTASTYRRRLHRTAILTSLLISRFLFLPLRAYPYTQNIGGAGVYLYQLNISTGNVPYLELR